MNWLADKVVLITGATKGIGRQMAVLFAQQGAQLVLNGRTDSLMTELCEELKAYTENEVISCIYDVRDVEAMNASFQRIKKRFGRLDALINNAGVLNDRLLGMIDQKSIDDTLDINLVAVIQHMQMASRMMKVQKQGSIVNISSIIGTNGNEGQVVYAASKAGVIGATQSAAKELAPFQIRVNAIAPGFIETDMARSIPPHLYQERLNSIKMKRIGKPEEVANTALFLCSDLSSYVTGQVIGVDGGMLI